MTNACYNSRQMHVACHDCEEELVNKIAVNRRGICLVKFEQPQASFLELQAHFWPKLLTSSLQGRCRISTQ